MDDKEHTEETNDQNSERNGESSGSSHSVPTVNGMDELIELMRRQAMQERNRQAHMGQAPVSGRVTNGEKGKGHAFWDTQPMPHERMSILETAAESSSSSAARLSAVAGATKSTGADGAREHGPIVLDKPKGELRQNPYNMPKGFEWCDLNIHDAAERKEIYELLSLNYVEDDDSMFRFDYSPEFLVWALTPPGFLPDFHLGVRSSKSGRLMAFISGVPATIRVFERKVSMVEINFLCVHKKLRSKRLAPVLIKEITRRVNLTGIFQAVYTAGLVLPVPVGTCRYYHRSLDPKKLIEVGFSRLGPRMTMARTQKLFKLPSETSTPNLRAMTSADVPGAHKLMTEYLSKFKLIPVMTVDELAHWLLPRQGVVNSYVASNPATGEITDLCSYYHLPSSVIGNAKHSKLRAAYSFYNVATSVSLTDLMRDCLILAKRDYQDVFNALNVMENDNFLAELKFGIGDGQLQYYLYNWSCPSMEAKDIGLVLL